jgi:hypothetical protein
VLLAGLEDFIDGGDMLRLGLVELGRQAEAERQIGGADVDAVEAISSTLSTPRRVSTMTKQSTLSPTTLTSRLFITMEARAGPKERTPFGK